MSDTAVTEAQTHTRTLTPFAELRRRVETEGLFNRQRTYYAWKIGQLAVLLALVPLPLIFFDALWIHLLDAVYFGFLLGQAGLMFHDGGHCQVFKRARWNNLVGHLCGFVMGASVTVWMEEHNEHHAHPNHEDSDPDIAVPFFVYSEKQAREAKETRGPILRFTIRHQAALYFPLMCFTALNIRINSLKYLWSHRAEWRRLWVDMLVVYGNVVLQLIFLFAFVPPLNAVFFIIVYHAVDGFYIGSIFAPNHKGMLTTAKDEHIDFLHEQILTSRNVKGGLLTNYLYGGLNYQVEHHLFPNMPRRNLGKANAIVKEFCKEQRIAYHETGVVQSYIEILRHMREISAYAR